MSTLILDGFEMDNHFGDAVKKLLDEKGDEYSYFKLRDTNILPCRSCGSCGFKSPGKCVFNDGIHDIMRSLARSKMIFMLTPVRFGGYSSQLKKVIDKLMPMGAPLYMVKDGHMLHPMRYGDKALVGIGLIEEKINGQEENFKLLLSRNALNMQFSYNKACIFKPSDSMEVIEDQIDSILKEVGVR